jgi:hypothetical protein
MKREREIFFSEEEKEQASEKRSLPNQEVIVNESASLEKKPKSSPKQINLSGEKKGFGARSIKNTKDYKMANSQVY